jgi:DNA-3-methyladenine glycosylase I
MVESPSRQVNAAINYSFKGIQEECPFFIKLEGHGQTMSMLINDEAASIIRCTWARTPLAIQYHDEEWGVPVFDERTLFEFLILEGAQAGLSWETILKKRQHYREVFDNFDAIRIASYEQEKFDLLLSDAGIIRNPVKIRATVQNAQAFLTVQQEFGTFSRFIWQFVDNIPQHNHWNTSAEVPTTTSASDAMSKALKQRGFKFVGSTICYAFMQATGMVNDHTADCFRRTQIIAMVYSHK